MKVRSQTNKLVRPLQEGCEETWSFFASSRRFSGSGPRWPVAPGVISAAVVALIDGPGKVRLDDVYAESAK
jgi:hypothetical protein